MTAETATSLVVDADQRVIEHPRLPLSVVAMIRECLREALAQEVKDESRSRVDLPANVGRHIP